MNEFHSSDGMAPADHDVPTKTTADEKDGGACSRRGRRSRPSTTEPTTVPVSAKKGSSAACVFGTPYSAVKPGMTKPSEAGFITSMTSATTSTAISPQWAGLQRRVLGRGDGDIRKVRRRTRMILLRQEPIGRDGDADAR